MFTFVTGLMGAGKSTRLIREVEGDQGAGWATLVLTAGSRVDGLITTRNGEVMTAAPYALETALSWAIKHPGQFSTVYVDEAQFLSEDDVLMLIVALRAYEVDVVFYGLLTTFKTELWPGSAMALRLAQRIEHLPAPQCETCKSSVAQFNARYTPDGVQDTDGPLVALDNSTAYLYVNQCISCYAEKEM